MINILKSESRTTHILFGETPGRGGHLWPGQFGKTPFPATWSSEKIMHYVSDIATDPSIIWKQTTGKSGALFTNAGKPVRFSTIAERECVKIKVVIEPAGEGIITGYPGA
ncbi:MAG: EndoU domain-containing protein [Verrucomicrobia bacterium]|nr:EndoU domain-containing protein [Verrucomicrobiota bacterium]